MSAAIPLSEIFHVRARFCRSVNIAADYRDPRALSDYIVTPITRAVLRRIAEGLRPRSKIRAWSLTGPYGAGKSACALFSAKILGYPINGDARALLRSADPELYEELFTEIPGLSEGGFFLVLSVGSRQPLSLAILQALLSGLTSWKASGTESLKLVPELEKLCESVRRGAAIQPEVITDVLDRTSRAVRADDKRVMGLLLILDELGKLLEYAALNPAQGDVFLLQSLAEMASRSGDNPVGLLAILHQAFERYADRLSPMQRREWAKVQGRFEDIGFLQSQAELLRLVGAAIEAGPMPNGFRHTIEQQASLASKLEFAPRDMSMRQTQEALTSCAPLHPTVALVLGRLFRSRLAQNERSLFAFLTSGEPYGLQDFLHRECWMGDGSQPFYRIDQLYDYVVSAMGSALYAQAQGKRWAEIEHALERLSPECEQIDARLIKAIGLLGLIGDQRYLRASTDTLVYALSDGREVTEEDIHTALDRLCTTGIAVYRKHKLAYGLWEGSDIDLDERFQKGLNQIDRSASLASLLRSHGRLKPYVAKRHLHETGTLRYFVPKVTDLEGLEQALTEPLGGADGAIIFVVANHGAEPSDTLNAVREVVAKVDEAQRVLRPIAVPKDVWGLREALEEVLGWEWVTENTPELEGDSIARKELSSRQIDAIARLDQLCSQSFDKATSYSACLWIWCGEERKFETSRELSSALSELCDHAYRYAPRVHNELVNRRNLSSSSAAARRNLIERMIENPSRPRFGIDTGFPPELSMYLSVFERTGLHHRQGEGWVLGPDLANDPSHISHIWEAIDRFMATTETGKRSVSELFAELREPPYGVRDGLLPIFLAAALMHWESEVALFETGTFLTQISMAAFERLMKVPEQFQLQRYRLHGTRLGMLKEYSRLFDGEGMADQPATLLTAVRPLLIAARRLPPFSRTTKRVSPEAVAVRDALFTAREPHQLLFESLPEALHIDPSQVSTDLDTARLFFDHLRATIQELQGAYASLLDELRKQLIESLRLPHALNEARKVIRDRASELQPCVADVKLKAFLNRLGDSTLPDDKWLESVAAGLVLKAPAQWNDQDLPRFQLALADMSTQLRKVEEVALESGLSSDDKRGGRLLRLSVLEASTEERKEVLRVLPHEEAEVKSLADRIDRQLKAEGVPEHLLVAALAELTARLLATPQPIADGRAR